MSEVHLFIHHENDQRLDEILRLLRLITKKEREIMADLNDLAAAVADEKTVVDSAVALLDGLAAQLAAALASNDPAAVQAVLDSITANRDELAAAVAADSPAAPAA